MLPRSGFWGNTFYEMHSGKMMAINSKHMQCPLVGNCPQGSYLRMLAWEKFLRIDQVGGLPSPAREWMHTLPNCIVMQFAQGFVFVRKL